MKCDTTRVSQGNPDLSSYGFCIRDQLGDLTYAEANQIGESSSVFVEATAIWKIRLYCKIRVFQNMIIETDSLFLMNILMRDWKIPWEIVKFVEEMQFVMVSVNIQINHVLREAN